MLKLARIRGVYTFFLLIGILLLVSSCDEVTTSAAVSYTLPFVPITFTIDTQGNITVHVSASLVTAIGTFSIEAGVSNSIKPEANTFLVIIRHKQKGSLVDTVYKIQTDQDEVTVVVDGKTTIQVTDRKVFIDASQSTIKSIVIKSPNSDYPSAHLYPPHSGKLVLNDPLVDNSKGYQWEEDTGTGDALCKFVNGAYHLSSQNNTAPFCLGQATNFKNFAFEVQMTIISGDGGGIIFGGDQAGDQSDFFEFYQDGTYEFFKWNGNGWDERHSGSTSALKTGFNQTNLIAVVVNGSQIDCYVNAQHIDSEQDNNYKGGAIGFIADDNNDQTEVAFANAKGWSF